MKSWHHIEDRNLFFPFPFPFLAELFPKLKREATGLAGTGFGVDVDVEGPWLLAPGAGGESRHCTALASRSLI